MTATLAQCLRHSQAAAVILGLTLVAECCLAIQPETPALSICFGDSLLELFLGSESFTSAEIFCNNRGGFLASVRDQAELNFLNETRSTALPQNTGLWLGITSIGTNEALPLIDRYRVTDPEPNISHSSAEKDFFRTEIGELPWFANEPNAAFSSCVVWPSGFGFGNRWIDVDCFGGDRYAYFCRSNCTSNQVIDPAEDLGTNSQASGFLALRITGFLWLCVALIGVAFFSTKKRFAADSPVDNGVLSVLDAENLPTAFEIGVPHSVDQSSIPVAARFYSPTENAEVPVAAVIRR